MGMANYLVANPLPETPICLNPDGEAFLQNIAAMEWWITNSSGAVIADGIDNWRVTSDGFYVVSMRFPAGSWQTDLTNVLSAGRLLHYGRRMVHSGLSR